MRVMLLLLAACGQTPCPTFEELQPFMERSCYKCHAKSVRGANRQGSPPEANYDDEIALTDRIDSIVARATVKGATHMPPATSTLPDLSSAEVERLKRWGECK